MSNKLMSQIWSGAHVEGSSLLVLLALADFANDKDICWPSLPTLAQRARISERQAQRLVQKLADDGHIEIMATGNGRRHSARYKVTPKVDIAMSPLPEIKDDKLSTFENGKGDNLSSFDGERVTSSALKVDIAMSPDPLEPPIETEEEDDTRDGIHQAWLDVLGDDVPANIETPLQNLLVECGEPAVIHGILAIPQSGSRSFKFIAACARNYIPPAPPGNEDGKSYQVDPYPYRGDQTSIQDDRPPVALKPPPPPVKPPKPTDDVWTIALAEMKYALPGAAVSYLDGSYIQAAGSVDNVPLYHIVVKKRAEAGLGWLTAQAGPAIRRKLSTLLGKSVLIEIVCKELAAAS
jgi:hypothetical protein